MAAFMIGRGLAVLFADHLGLALQTHIYLVLGVFEVHHLQLFLAALGGQQRGLVDQVLEVGTGKSWCALGQIGGIDILIHGRLFHVHREDLLAPPDVGKIDHHLSVESARPQQCRVENVGPVGGRDEDDAFVGLEPVHFHQQLIEGLFAFVVTAAQTGAAVAPDRIDFIDKDNAGGVLLALDKEVADARSADTDKHLHEIRAADAEKRHSGLTGDGPGQQRLARARRAHEQYTLGDASAQAGEFFRVAQEIDHLAQFLLGLIDTRHILEGDLLLGVGHEPGPAFAER